MEDPNDLLYSLPTYFLRPPLLIDVLSSQTSSLQAATLEECLPLLSGAKDPSRNPFDFNNFGIPKLEREEHVAFLEENLSQFPQGFVGLDASRPWMVYWGLLGLYLLGEDVSTYRSRILTTFYPLQNPSGGFGGGQGHYSHLASTYPTLLCLALVGGEKAYTMVDRFAMWQWLGRLKQPTGGFQVCEGGEEDVRGAYCALVAISLLNLPLELPPNSPACNSGLETFNDGLGNYLSRCQTYEGGLSGAPGNEAHGAYAFCAIACLCLLGTPQQSINQHLDVDALLWWLSSRQYAPEGGFAGRTNKLVDGCYSHWIGGCWPLVQAAIDGPLDANEAGKFNTVGTIFNREGLARYILGCCQAPDGGLRDKPSKRPDSYHTCYNLVGVSLVEHFHFYRKAEGSSQFDSAFTWQNAKSDVFLADGEKDDLIDDQIPAIHPVYVIPHSAVLAMRHWSEKNQDTRLNTKSKS